LLGVTTESLRNYQKLGILESRKEENSTYKHFNSISVGRLLAMRKMQTAGYCLADISQSMKEYSLQEYYKTFMNNTQTTKQKLEYQKLLIERMESHLLFAERLMNNRFEFNIEKSPVYYCFDYLTDNEIIVQDCHMEQFNQWTQHMLFALNYSPSPLNSLTKGSLPIRIGLAVEEKFLKALNLNIFNPVYMRPSKESLTCIIRHHLNGKLIGNSEDKIFEYLNYNKLSAISEPFYVNEISYHQMGEEFFFSKLYIPLE